MKTITIPSDIELLDPISQEPYTGPDGKRVLKTFKKHAFDVWLSDQRASSNMSELERWIGVCAKFRSIDASTSSLELEDQDFEKLASIVREPKNGYGNPLVDMQLIPFSKAVLEAK